MAKIQYQFATALNFMSMKLMQQLHGNNSQLSMAQYVLLYNYGRFPRDSKEIVALSKQLQRRKKYLESNNRYLAKEIRDKQLRAKDKECLIVLYNCQKNEIAFLTKLTSTQLNIVSTDNLSNISSEKIVYVLMYTMLMYIQDFDQLHSELNALVSKHLSLIPLKFNSSLFEVDLKQLIKYKFAEILKKRGELSVEQVLGQCYTCINIIKQAMAIDMLKNTLKKSCYGFLSSQFDFDGKINWAIKLVKNKFPKMTAQTLFDLIFASLQGLFIKQAHSNATILAETIADSFNWVKTKHSLMARLSEEKSSCYLSQLNEMRYVPDAVVSALISWGVFNESHQGMNDKILILLHVGYQDLLECGYAKVSKSVQFDKLVDHWNVEAYIKLQTYIHAVNENIKTLCQFLIEKTNATQEQKQNLQEIIAYYLTPLSGLLEQLPFDQAFYAICKHSCFKQLARLPKDAQLHGVAHDIQQYLKGTVFPYLKVKPEEHDALLSKLTIEKLDIKLKAQAMYVIYSRAKLTTVSLRGKMVSKVLQLDFLSQAATYLNDLIATLSRLIQKEKLAPPPPATINKLSQQIMLVIYFTRINTDLRTLGAYAEAYENLSKAGELQRHPEPASMSTSLVTEQAMEALPQALPVKHYITDSVVSETSCSVAESSSDSIAIMGDDGTGGAPFEYYDIFSIKTDDMQADNAQNETREFADIKAKEIEFDLLLSAQTSEVPLLSQVSWQQRLLLIAKYAAVVTTIASISFTLLGLIALSIGVGVVTATVPYGFFGMGLLLQAGLNGAALVASFAAAWTGICLIAVGLGVGVYQGVNGLVAKALQFSTLSKLDQDLNGHSNNKFFRLNNTMEVAFIPSHDRNSEKDEVSEAEESSLSFP